MGTFSPNCWHDALLTYYLHYLLTCEKNASRQVDYEGQATTNLPFSKPADQNWHSTNQQHYINENKNYASTTY